MCQVFELAFTSLLTKINQHVSEIIAYSVKNLFIIIIIIICIIRCSRRVQ